MTKKTSAMRFSELLSKTSIMADNILLNAEKLKKVGMDVPTVTGRMKSNGESATELDKEQERLKAQTRAKTEELDAVTDEMRTDYAEAKKLIKIAEPQVNWIAYGIEDKR